MSLFDRYASTVARTLARAGDPVTIFENDDTATNIYGSPVDSWSEIGETVGVLFWGSRSGLPDVNTTTAGRYVTDSPMLIVPTTDLIAEGGRVAVRENTYRVDTKTAYPTYDMLTLTGVTEHE
jgi:hypothetical protein